MNARARETLEQILPVTGGLLDGAPFGLAAHSLPLIDPDSGTEIARLGENSPDDVALAVDAARIAFEDQRWAGRSLAERAKVLRDVARLVRDEEDHLAALDSLTTGLLWHRSTRRQAATCADWFEFFAHLAEAEGSEAFATGPGLVTNITREPVGVVGLFTPWNIPLMAAGLKLAAALVMGNSVVTKPSELSPLGTYRLVQLLHEAGVPVGVVQLVNGRGQVTGKALAEHPNVAAISFTGGPVAGAAIASAATARFAKITMELGGKSANIVLADAPYEAALDGTIAAAFGNSGQACLAGSRILVEAPIAERFIADLVEHTQALNIGHTFDEDAQIGAQSSESQMERVLGYVDIAREEGAELLCGGKRALGFEGFQVEPAIMRVTDNSLRICQEEVFGPLVTVQVVSDADEAVAVANDTKLGLAGYVWSEDEAKAADIAARLRAGTVLVNTPMVRERNAPFGGYGASGIDREGGRWSLDFYSEAKTTVTRKLSAGQQEKAA